MTSQFRAGWAACRENTCNHDEYGKQTWDKWMGCCPSEMTYSTDDNDNKRCTFGDTPSGTADTPTQCADPSLFLWSDSAGYFCCDKDMIGFVNNVHWKGCVSTEVFSKGQKDGSMTKATWNGQKQSEFAPV